MIFTFRNPIKLVNRFIKAQLLGFLFLRSATFKLPKKIKTKGKFINLYLPNEHGIKISFVEILLDDVYKLNLIKKMSVKNNFLIRSILDIGANCGLFCVAARLNFPSSIINAYEPNLFIRKYLKYQSSSFNFNYFIKAVGKNDGSLKLHINPQESVLSSSLNDFSQYKVNQIVHKVVPKLSIKKVFQRTPNKILDIVKMDCEGAEWEILTELNIWKHVRFLTMEYHLDKSSNYNNIAKAINKIGFVLITNLRKSKGLNYGTLLAYNPKMISQ
jgi:FkbM family methyltransferase